MRPQFPSTGASPVLHNSTHTPFRNTATRRAIHSHAQGRSRRSSLRRLTALCDSLGGRWAGHQESRTVEGELRAYHECVSWRGNPSAHSFLSGSEAYELGPRFQTPWSNLLSSFFVGVDFVHLSMLFFLRLGHTPQYVSVERRHQTDLRCSRLSYRLDNFWNLGLWTPTKRRLLLRAMSGEPLSKAHDAQIQRSMRPCTPARLSISAQLRLNLTSANLLEGIDAARGPLLQRPPHTVVQVSNAPNGILGSCLTC